MGSIIRFVQPEKVRLYLGGSDGAPGTEWIEVKKRLSVGEARAAVTSFVGAYTADGSRIPNRDTLGMGQVIAYLLDWSARDAEDRPVPVTLDALKSLDLSSYAVIETAIEKHIAAVEAADAEAEKKIPASAALV